MNTLKRGILSLALLSGFSSNAQNLVSNGDFEGLTPAGLTSASQCYWVPPSTTGSTPSVPQPTNGNWSINQVAEWEDYRNGGVQGIDLKIDARGWILGSYWYDTVTHQTCNTGASVNYFPTFETPNEFGTLQTSGLRMLDDANPSNNKKAYPKFEASMQPTVGTDLQRNDFLEGHFTSQLDLFKKYRLTFKYSVPCDEGASANTTENRIVFNLFDSEWKSHEGADYGNLYLPGLNVNSAQIDIDASSFHPGEFFDANGVATSVYGSRRLPVLDYVIPAGTPPCQWQTVTIEFCIADLMNNPANNAVSSNPLYNSIPLGYMNNAHLFDVDFYDANKNGWPYTYTQQPTIASYVNDYLSDGTLLLFDFKNIFGFTVKGHQNVYLDDVSVVETNCNMNANFTVEQACSTDVNGNKFVTFRLTPNGPNQNPYMFQVRNAVTGGAFTTINNSLPLTGTHTYTVPYVQGQQFEFKMGTWSPTSGTCGWIETRQTHTVDPNGNWFPKNPDFTISGIQNYLLPPSMFAIVANPNTAFLGTPSKWEIQVYYKNGTNSVWLPVSTNGNLTGNGNSQFVMWFDCEDAYSPIVNPSFIYSNVNFVKVRRTNYGTCDLTGKSIIKQYVNCQVNGKSMTTDESIKLDDVQLNELKKLYNLDDNTYSVTPFTANQDFDVFPNPASDFIHLRFESELDRSIKLINVQGKVVKEINSNETLLTINIEELEAGVYLLTTKDDDCIITKRIIKK